MYITTEILYHDITRSALMMIMVFNDGSLHYLAKCRDILVVGHALRTSFLIVSCQDKKLTITLKHFKKL